MPGDGRKSQRGVSTDGRGGFWHSPRSCPEPLELVGLKFSWSPTRLYRRVERVGTTVEPLRLEARESQILFLNPLFPTRQNVGAQFIAPRRPPVFPTHFFSLRFFEIY